MGDLKMQTSSSDSETLIGCKSYALIASSIPQRASVQPGWAALKPAIGSAESRPKTWS